MLPVRVTVTPAGMLIVVNCMKPLVLEMVSMLMVVVVEPGNAPLAPEPPLRLPAEMVAWARPARKLVVVEPMFGPSRRTRPAEPSPPKVPYLPPLV